MGAQISSQAKAKNTTYSIRGTQTSPQARATSVRIYCSDNLQVFAPYPVFDREWAHLEIYGSHSVPTSCCYTPLLVDPKYSRTTTPPWDALPEEMKTSIYKELRYIYFEITAYEQRQLDKHSAHNWEFIGFLPNVQYTVNSALDMAPEDIVDLFNKEVAVYFNDSYDAHKAYDKISRYLYKTWLHLYNGRPPFQRGGFFAKSLRFHGGLDDLLAFHRRLSGALSKQMESSLQFELYQVGWGFIERWRPLPSPTIQSFRQHGYRMRPLFRALYMVVHIQEDAQVPEYRPAQRGDECFLGCRDRLATDMISQYPVLLVRTGQDSELSSPISFQPLFDAGLAINVNRSDYKDELEATVVMVWLDTAVQFIWDLLVRERAACKDFDLVEQGLSDEQDVLCHAWADKVVEMGQEVGLDEVPSLWLASRRALARANGEAFDENQVSPTWELMDRWRL